MYIQARERMDALENRINDQEEEVANPTTTRRRRRRNYVTRIKWYILDVITGFVGTILVSLALLRFILYGIS